MGSCDQHEKRRRGSVYESIWATWHHWGHSQGLSPLLCALCSYTTPGCSAKSVNCIRKQMGTSRSEVTTINYESNFFPDIPIFFLNIVHETYKQIWILPITCIIEKNMIGNYVSRRFGFGGRNKHRAEQWFLCGNHSFVIQLMAFPAWGADILIHWEFFNWSFLLISIIHYGWSQTKQKPASPKSHLQLSEMC